MTSQNYDIIKNNANVTWHYVKRNMIYKKLQTVSDLIQRKEIEIFAMKKAASCKKRRLVENRL